jgi:hypothetical protein
MLLQGRCGKSEAADYTQKNSSKTMVTYQFLAIGPFLDLSFEKFGTLHANGKERFFTVHAKLFCFLAVISHKLLTVIRMGMVECENC